MKIEKGLEGSKESKIENLYQFLGFLKKEFGKEATEEFFKPLLEQRAGADIVMGDHAKPKKERLKRLKNKEVTPIIVAKLNQAIDFCLKKHPKRLKENLSEKEKEMLNAIEGKEVVMNEEGNIVIKEAMGDKK